MSFDSDVSAADVEAAVTLVLENATSDVDVVDAQSSDGQNFDVSVRVGPSGGTAAAHVSHTRTFYPPRG